MFAAVLNAIVDVGIGEVVVVASTVDGGQVDVCPSSFGFELGLLGEAERPLKFLRSVREAAREFDTADVVERTDERLSRADALGQLNGLGSPSKRLFSVVGDHCDA